MDGVRARRLGTGSPLGRIIDEALDMVQQTCYSLWMAYTFRFDNMCFESIFLAMNVVFWSMEMKFILFKDLKMIVGEVGPVEVELIIAFVIFLGGYLGAEVF